MSSCRIPTPDADDLSDRLSCSTPAAYNTRLVDFWLVFELFSSRSVLLAFSTLSKASSPSYPFAPMDSPTEEPDAPNLNELSPGSSITEDETTDEDDADTEDGPTTPDDVAESNMCRACQGINFESLTAEHMIPRMGLCKGYRWHATFDDWMNSKREGCYSCREAWLRFYAKQSPNLEDTSSYSIWLCIDGVDTVPPINSWDTHKAEIGHRVALAYVKPYVGERESSRVNVWLREEEMIWFTLEGDPAASRSSLPVMRNLEPTTVSGSSFAIASKWLQDCLLHELEDDVSDGIPSPNLEPLRLLEIDTKSCRVCKTAMILQETLTSLQYATLSYCWGKVDAHKTTKANVENRERFIDVDILPATIRDAITIARGLDIKYLWVDALCIVQDDPNEWHSEAANMAKIYKNALVNIAAGVGSDANAGCFSNVDTRLARACHKHEHTLQTRHQVAFPSMLKDGQESWLGWLNYIDEGRKDFDKDVSRGPLTDRTWVIQERLFSPRILHYTQDQLYWECQHCILSENGLPLGYLSSERSAKLRPLVRSYGTWPEGYEKTQRGLSVLWFNVLVELYSETRLTRGSDKLIAVSGLAKVFAQAKGPSQYMAGLWENDLYMGLQWYRDTDDQTNVGKKTEIYRAPSWSWASQDGKVCYNREWRNTHYSKAFDMNIRFIAYTPQLVGEGEDPFGGVENASLTVEARLIADEAVPVRFKDKTRFDLDRLDRLLLKQDRSDETLAFRSIDEDKFDRSAGKLRILESLGAETAVYFDSDLPILYFDSDPPRTPKVFCMPLELAKEDHWSDFRALLLQPTGLASTYRRIGLAHIDVMQERDIQRIRELLMQSPLQTITLV